MARVSTHVFTCDTCGKEEVLQFKDDEPKRMPDGWIVVRARAKRAKPTRKQLIYTPPPASHYCSESCRPVKVVEANA